MEPVFRLAARADLPAIMAIIADAKALLKKQGSEQWQNGYPDKDCIAADLLAKSGWLIELAGKSAGYLAICLSGEPAYATLAGNWLLPNATYGVIHRMAVGSWAHGHKLGEKAIVFAEQIMRKNRLASSRIDTDEANKTMQYLLNRLGYQYCGKVWFQASEKIAFEKILATGDSKSQ